MADINVVVASTRRDVNADVIAEAIKRRDDMHLVGGRYLKISEVEAVVSSLPTSERCALIICGSAADTADTGEAALEMRGDLAVLRVTSVGEVRVGASFHQMGLLELIDELRSLVNRVGLSPGDRARLVQLHQFSSKDANSRGSEESSRHRPVLECSIDWVHVVMQNAVASLPEPDESSNSNLLTWTKTTVLQELARREAAGTEPVSQEVSDAETALIDALRSAHARNDTLAMAFRELGLTFLEFRMLLLALAPEIDPVYQRCAGLLLDEMSRRVGTFGLYAALLGDAADVCGELAATNSLVRWRLFDGCQGHLPAADEPLRLDTPFCGWLLGKPDALAQDPRVRRTMRLVSWPGASVLDTREQRERAAALVHSLQVHDGSGWVLLAGGDAPAWRALVELGALVLGTRPTRVDMARLSGLDILEVEESAVRLARLARLTSHPLIIDACATEEGARDDDASVVFLAAIGSSFVRAAVIAHNEVRIVRLLGAIPHALAELPALHSAARIEAIRAAATGSDAYLGEAGAQAIASQYPLQVDAIEQAMRLARSRPLVYPAEDARLDRFIAAVKEMAAEGVSRLAERIEPVFRLDDVVLPADRKQQLLEIVDSIRLAPRVLDEWKFREQLPYGRGVTALFHGSSGTGKTMAALGVARELGVQILRLDLSRVVSKYIGDTEKNIDHVFSDAERSGCAILVDEADALLGKRSEVKDSHDRYANIEVAYLLQRMEAFEGLAILTTNLRQNLDPAFLRRLRFVVDFPRPDADARERIWRRCLPAQSHALDDAAFRQLARRIELTGGHIRQITLRAAFAAAAAGTPIGLAHIARAARAELEKLGMPPVDIDLAERKRAA